MKEIALPPWFQSAILTALIAFIGYFAKSILTWLNGHRLDARGRKTKLIELYSLLRATRSAYLQQCKNRDSLYEVLSKKYSDLSSLTIGYDEFFSKLFEEMNSQEKETHSIIRAFTEYTLQPLNENILKWLQSDTFFKSRNWSKNKQLCKLAHQLMQLEAHLYLWQAKFSVWIPDHPEHSLVYLADEKDQGISFPAEVDELVGHLLQKQSLNYYLYF